MIRWELKETQFSTTNMSKANVDKMFRDAYDIVEPCMEYFCNRLSEMDNWTIDDAKVVFGEIVDDLPIMRYHITNDGEFIIRYNRYIDVILTDSIKQIYREQKLNKIL